LPSGTANAEAVASATAATGTAAAGAAADTPGLPARIWAGFRKGGPLMWVLLVTSIIGLTYALERMMSLRRRTHLPRGLAERVERALRAGEFEKARAVVKNGEGALAAILRGLLARRRATRAERERILEDETGRVLWDLRRNVRPVGMVSSISPLLGLLGTVIGLILAFQEAATKGMDDPAHFAAGIYEALYTTAFGLTVAIPFLLLHHYLRGRSDSIVRAAEARALRLVVEMDESGVWDPPAPAPEAETAPAGAPADSTETEAETEAEPEAEEVCAVMVEAA
jgi:biopolymer transport protein ExbB